MRMTLATMALCCSPLAAVAPHATADQHATAQLVVETTAAIPGQTLHVGINFQIERDWHLYWNGRNDSGAPIEFTLDLPEGWTAGPTQWPAPVRHLMPGEILDHIYEKTVTLIVPVQVPAAAKGEFKLTADVRWLVCNEACVAEKAKVIATVPIAPTAQPGPNAPLFAAARLRVPKPLPTTGAAIPRVSITAGAIQMEADGATGLSFFPALDCPEIRNLSEAGTSDGPKPRLTMSFSESHATPPAPSGVLEVRYPDKTAWYQITPPAPPAESKKAPSPAAH